MNAPSSTPKPPAPPTLEELASQVRSLEEETRRTLLLLQQHVEEERKERETRHQRYEGIVSLLGQVLERLPSTPTS